MSTLDLTSVIAANLRAVQQNPDDFFAHFNLARAYECKGRMEEALIAYQKAVTINPGDPFVRQALAELFVRFGQPQQAKLVFQRLIAEHPDFIAAHVGLARLLVQEGQKEESIVRLKRCLNLDPDLDEAYYLLFCVYREIDFFKEALSSIQQAVRIRPRYYLYLREKAAFLNQIGDKKNALYEIRRALASYPQDRFSLELAAHLAYEGNDFVSAERYLNQLLDMEPYSVKGLGIKGNWLVNQGKLEQAEAVFRQVFRIRPDCQDVLPDLARLHVMKTQYASALAVLSRLKPADSVKTQTLLLKVEALIGVKNFREAGSILEELLERRVYQEDVFYWLGELGIHRHQIAEALSYFRLGWELEPKKARSLRRIAELEDSLGHVEEARVAFELLAGLERDSIFQEEEEPAPNNSKPEESEERGSKEWQKKLALDGESLENLTGFGDFLFSCGNLEQALKRWEMANALYPGFLPLLLRIVEALRIQGNLLEALEYLQKMRDEWPESDQVFLAEVSVLLEHGKPDQAVAVLRQMRILFPEHPEAEVLELRLARLMDDEAVMQRLSDELLLKNPTHILALKVRSWLCIRRQDFALARSSLEQVLKITENSDVESLHQMAGLEETSQNFARASACYEAILEVEETAWVHARLGMVHAQLLNPMMAIHHLQKSLQMDPDLEEARLKLANIFVEQEEFQKAMLLVDPLLSQERFLSDAAMIMAVSLAKLNQHQKALQWLDLIRKHQPLEPMNWYLMAQSLESLQEWARAHKAYSKVLELAPQNSRLYEFAQESLVRLPA